MPLDTSIPLQFNQAAPAQAINPMTIYQLMQDRQSNALRAQMYQQEMAKNAMIMQNTAEDRRIAAAGRAQAAAQAAEERRRLAEYRGILGGFGTTPSAIGQRGAGYSGTGVSTDPYEPVRNQLLRGGFVPQAEELTKVQKEILAGEESKAKIPGLVSESAKKGIETVDAQLKQLNTGLERAASPEEVDALFDGSADAIRATGKTPEMSKATFRQLAGRVGFDNAKMQVAQGIMATQKHFSDMLTGQAGRSDVTQDAAGNQIIIDKATGTAMPVMMADAPAAAGAPVAAGAPAAPPAFAPVKAKLSGEAEKAAVKSKETAKGLEEATTILEGLVKEGSLLDQATGSYFGSWADIIANSVGYPLEGAKAAKSLKTLADPILKMVPRFEGPQSDKDTQTYKEAAGELADETLPADIRRAAAKTLLMLFNRRKGEFVSADMLANVQSGGTVSTAPAAGSANIPTGWSHEVMGR